MEFFKPEMVLLAMLRSKPHRSSNFGALSDHHIFRPLNHPLVTEKSCRIKPLACVSACLNFLKGRIMALTTDISSKPCRTELGTNQFTHAVLSSSDQLACPATEYLQIDNWILLPLLGKCQNNNELSNITL